MQARTKADKPQAHVGEGRSRIFFRKLQGRIPYVRQKREAELATAAFKEAAEQFMRATKLSGSELTASGKIEEWAPKANVKIDYSMGVAHTLHWALTLEFTEFSQVMGKANISALKNTIGTSVSGVLSLAMLGAAAIAYFSGAPAPVQAILSIGAAAGLLFCASKALLALGYRRMAERMHGEHAAMAKRAQELANPKKE